LPCLASPIIISAMPEMKLCKKCGRENLASASACTECGRGEFYDPYQTGGVPEPPAARDESGLGSLLALVAVAPALMWVVFTFFYAPSHPDAGPPQLTPRASAPSPEVAVQEALSTRVPNADPRLELMGGNNLDIYVSRSSFEDVPYPDRQNAIREVGKAWCEKVTGFFFPAVRIRDVRSGKVMASFGCVLGRGSVEGQ